MTSQDTLDLAALDAQDEATLDIRHPKSLAPTGWVWTFYGPGHPVTVGLANRVAEAALKKAAARRQAQANGRKWKEDEQSLAEITAENVEAIVARTKSFSPIKFDGQLIEFSADAARGLLRDRRKAWLFEQVSEFLRDEVNFIQPSATS
ncbi:hypothetical protein BRADO3639 [Bradyrhizobium sp. ORS 278]|uniref:hypothetical protein n=1 Tax=Bradyrhizobium sp. (strain ORS 278) TaxID=114615 RepID=UPI0001508F4B|nr:hypothetical protein [Bradyrhizobium sp. ORS 278]CAL77416.1 hypothetical protein BRADO3639 [Bradyrhizobium sp. ORS 278]